MIEEKQIHYEESDLYKIRHSTAHVMAEAVLEMFPKGAYSIGPPIKDGFYYDFDLPRALTQEDLKKIEKRMKNIIKGNHEFKKRVVSADEAREIFKDQPYKLELIDGLDSGGFDEYGEPLEGDVEISVYEQDNFIDLCRGPHVNSTMEINPTAVKLLSTAGAYWRGDENRPQLQRIYGTAWHNADELELYLWKLEEAKKRDHRRLGRELDLYSTHEDVGAGLILWHPNGGIVRRIIEEFWSEKHKAGGYDFVYTPHIGKSSLWDTSGHLDFYKDDMYSAMEIDGQEYYLKPMNCPFHIHIYQSHTRSYRDMPLRYGEMGTVYRYERSGVLHGLLRVRGFTQDDAHHFCRPDQMKDELEFVVNFSVDMIKAFGLSDFKAYLSTRPEKFVGEPQQWDDAQKALTEVLEEMEMPYEIDEGGGAFYGPKIDLYVRDAIEREWQISTIQFDFNLPERFDISYIGSDGEKHRPLMVHRALLGSMERFFGVLIEHYAGAFPVWLAPVQAVIIPIADRHADYSAEISEMLLEKGIRVELDDSSERMANKIRKAQDQKVPYMLIVGDREVENLKVSVRLRTEEDLGSMDPNDLLLRIEKAIRERDGL
jgi:threonyl-tRNA synthetase